MELSIVKLSKEHLPMVDAFTCAESVEELKSQGVNSKNRKRIIAHSKDMEDFLKDESIDEQDKHLNITYLLIDNVNKILVGYVSLCNDCIRLELDEKEELALTYATIPAMKIARLAVDNRYKGHGFGKMLIQFSAYIAQEIQSQSGLVFITLDCYEHRLPFYERIGFVRNAIQPIQLEYDSPISMRISLDKYLQSLESEL